MEQLSPFSLGPGLSVVLNVHTVWWRESSPPSFTLSESHESATALLAIKTWIYSLYPTLWVIRYQSVVDFSSLTEECVLLRKGEFFKKWTARLVQLMHSRLLFLPLDFWWHYSHTSPWSRAQSKNKHEITNTKRSLTLHWLRPWEFIALFITL